MYNIFYGTYHLPKWDTIADALTGAVEQNSITIDLVRYTFASYLLACVLSSAPSSPPSPPLAFPRSGNVTYITVRKYVDKIVLVSEEQIESAMQDTVFNYGFVGMPPFFQSLSSPLPFSLSTTF